MQWTKFSVLMTCEVLFWIQFQSNISHVTIFCLHNAHFLWNSLQFIISIPVFLQDVLKYKTWSVIIPTLATRPHSRILIIFYFSPREHKRKTSITLIYFSVQARRFPLNRVVCTELTLSNYNNRNFPIRSAYKLTNRILVFSSSLTPSDCLGFRLTNRDRICLFS